MKKLCPTLSGFTLIELLVATSIMGILLGIGIIAYNRFNRRQTLAQAVKTLKNDLRLAQSKALSGEKDAEICGSGISARVLDGWFVSFTESSYTLYGSCAGSPFALKKVDLPANVSFSPVPETIPFKPLTQGVPKDKTIEITLIAPGENSLTVRVSPSGDIYQNE